MGKRAAAVLVGVSVALIAAWYVGRRPEPGRLLAFDLHQGTLLLSVHAQTASVHLHAIGAGVVVVSGADSCNYPSHGEQLYAYSLPGGRLRWKRGLQGACDDFHPVDPVSNGIVAVAAWPALEGWSASDGSTRWRSTRFAGAVRQSADRIVSVDSNTGAVRFLDPLDGRLLQTGVARSKPFPWTITPTEAILVTQGRDDPVVEELTALDPASGRRLWRQTLGPTGGFGAPSGADGVVLAGWEGATRSLAENARVSYAAFDAASGRRLWLRRGFLDLEAAGSGLALFEQHATIEADDLRTGALRWHRRIPGWRAGYRMIVAGEGAVAVIDRDRVTVLRSRDGAVSWSRRLPTDGLAAYGPPAISAGMLVIPGQSSSYTPYDE